MNNLLSSHPVGIKRKHGSPKKKQTGFPSSFDTEHESHQKRQQRPPDLASYIRVDRDAPPLMYTNVEQRSCNEQSVDDCMFLRQFDNEDPQELACCSNSMTALGRFGVWHPEESVFRESTRCQFTFPGEEELKSMYKLPRRKPKQREDGPGGQLLFLTRRTIQCSPTSTSVIATANTTGHDQNMGSTSVSETCSKSISDQKVVEKSLKWDETYDEMDEDMKFSDLRTGDDAIKYFSELESRVPVELVYCNRASSGKEFSPYNLVIVPRANVEPEHFIISATGIVHVEPGSGSVIEGTAISLEEWQHEKSIFLSLRRIKFFGKYLIQKAFCIWKKYVGRRNFKRVRETLILKLFKGKPAFLSALLQIHGYICDLMDLKMLLFASNRLYTMDEFLEAQNQQRHHVASPAVEACSDKIQQVLGKVCQDVKKQAQIFRV